MALDLEITNTNCFAGWEGGSFNPKADVGSAVLIAGADAEKLPVLYDIDPTKSRKHFLIGLNPDYLIVQVQVNTPTKNYAIVRVALKRVKQLMTANIQGHSVPRAELERLWACQVKVDVGDYAKVCASYTPDLVGYREEYLDLMKAAVQKATTERQDQRLFWGIPRRKPEQ